MPVCSLVETCGITKKKAQSGGQEEMVSGQTKGVPVRKTESGVKKKGRVRKKGFSGQKKRCPFYQSTPKP